MLAGYEGFILAQAMGGLKTSFEVYVKDKAFLSQNYTRRVILKYGSKIKIPPAQF